MGIVIFFAVALGRCGRCLRHLATKGDATKGDLPSNLADHLAACLGNVGSHRVCLSVESLHLVGALLAGALLGRCSTLLLGRSSLAAHLAGALHCTWQIQLGNSTWQVPDTALGRSSWQFYLAVALHFYLADPAWQSYLAPHLASLLGISSLVILLGTFT